MSRTNVFPIPRIATTALSALAVAIATALFTTAPARAEHFEDALHHHVARVAASHMLLAGELFFGPPVVHVAPPVIVHREVVYERPYYYEHHTHYDGCGHGHVEYYGHGRPHGKHWKHKKHWKHGGHHAYERGHGRGARYEVGHRGGRY